MALVGSGEFLEVMVPVDAELLAGRPQRAVFLPTASAEEGPERVRYWIELATAHYASMGVEPVPLEVLDREDAERPELASRVAGAGLVYLSGGNPGYLAHTLAGTAVWQAILEAWRSGAALAGCSAGACALSRIADDFREPGRYCGRRPRGRAAAGRASALRPLRALDARAGRPHARPAPRRTRRWSASTRRPRSSATATTSPSAATSRCGGSTATGPVCSSGLVSDWSWQRRRLSRQRHLVVAPRVPQVAGERRDHHQSERRSSPTRAGTPCRAASGTRSR